MRGTWCDGLFGYLAGNPHDWPAYMDDGSGRSVVLHKDGIVDVSPLREEDRIYLCEADTRGVLPDWAIRNIMEALQEGRRVKVCAATLATVAAVCHAVGLPLAGWEPDGQEGPELPN